MHLGEEFSILGDWFIIHFTENKGMAFGLEFAGDNGKLFLSLFRIIAVIAIGYYLFKLSKEKAPDGLLRRSDRPRSQVRALAHIRLAAR